MLSSFIFASGPCKSIEDVLTWPRLLCGAAKGYRVACDETVAALCGVH